MGKTCYNKASAMAAKNWRYKKDHVELRVYECHLGPHWHLTSRLEDFYPKHKIKLNGKESKKRNFKRAEK